MALNALDFLSSWLLDRHAGGVYASSDESGQRLLSTAKHLLDQANAVLTLAHHGRAEDLTVAFEGLLRLQDIQHSAGFCELTDRYWRPHPAGHVRTVRYQLLGAAAMLAAAQRLDADEYRVRAVDLINRCLELARDGQFPASLTEDWRGELGGPATPQTAVAAIQALAAARAADEPGVDDDSLPVIAKRLAELAAGASASHPPPWLRRCGAMARLAIALGQASQLLGSDEYAQCADLIMRTVLLRFRGAGQDGFWDRLAPDGSVRVDWIDAPRDGHAPFPVIRAADAAHLLRASQLLSDWGVDCTAVADVARATLDGLADSCHGGFFFARGFEWVTASETGTVSPQMLWSPPAQPGVYTYGGLREMSLVQKSAHVQALVARALGSAPVSAAIPPPHPGPRPDDPRASDQRAADRRAGSHNLAAVREPGVVWSVRELVYGAARQVLDQGLVSAPETLIARVSAVQNDDGGFGERPGSTSSLAATYRAVMALRLAGAQPADVGRTIGYVEQCRNAGGGYGQVPGAQRDVCHTALGAATLRALEALDQADEDSVSFVLAGRAGDGGYPDRPGLPPGTIGTRYAITALALYGQPAPEPAATVSWLRDLQTPAGGFAQSPGGTPSLVGTYQAVTALALLGSAPGDQAGSVRWLRAERMTLRGHGYPAVIADFAAAHALAVLTSACPADSPLPAG